MLHKGTISHPITIDLSRNDIVVKFGRDLTLNMYDQKIVENEWTTYNHD